jgi:hypothetical protein
MHLQYVGVEALQVELELELYGLLMLQEVTAWIV